MSATVVELRCPNGLKPLLLKLRLSGEPLQVSAENLMMHACRDCARNARQIDPSVRRVIHHFDFAGNLVESVVERGER